MLPTARLRPFAFLLALSGAAAVHATATLGTAADVSGTYKWQQQGGGGGGGGGGGQEVTLTLKQDGEKLTGTISARNGDVAIEEGTVKAGPDNTSTVSFKVTADMNGQKRVTTYTGTVTGDTIKLKSEMTTTRDIEGKKS